MKDSSRSGKPCGGVTKLLGGTTTAGCPIVVEAIMTLPSYVENAAAPGAPTTPHVKMSCRRHKAPSQPQGRRQNSMLRRSNVLHICLRRFDALNSRLENMINVCNTKGHISDLYFLNHILKKPWYRPRLTAKIGLSPEYVTIQFP